MNENQQNNDNNKNSENDIKIICPSCGGENTFNLPENGCNCSVCNSKITGYTYKHFIFSAMTVLSLGAIGGMVIDDKTHISRASVKVEYKMMKTCINDYDIDWYRGSSKRRDICACAVESLSGLLDAQRIKFTHNADDLKTLLKERYQECEKED